MATLTRTLALLLGAVTIQFGYFAQTNKSKAERLEKENVKLVTKLNTTEQILEEFAVNTNNGNMMDKFVSVPFTVASSFSTYEIEQVMVAVAEARSLDRFGYVDPILLFAISLAVNKDSDYPMGVKNIRYSGFSAQARRCAAIIATVGGSFRNYDQHVNRIDPNFLGSQLYISESRNRFIDFLANRIAYQSGHIGDDEATVQKNWAYNVKTWFEILQQDESVLTRL